MDCLEGQEMKLQGDEWVGLSCGRIESLGELKQLIFGLNRLIILYFSSLYCFSEFHIVLRFVFFLFDLIYFVIYAIKTKKHMSAWLLELNVTAGMTIFRFNCDFMTTVFLSTL